MNATEFLRQRVYGYAELDGDEHAAIQEFTLLWSAFEGALLGTEASPAGLLSVAHELKDRGQLDMGRFAEPLAYFQNRYWRNGEFTAEYSGLRVEKFKRKSDQSLVQQALGGAALPPEAVLGALLLVVYRLRNNLFHGVKWAYGIRGQRTNFVQACAVLMAVMELSGGAE